MIATAGATFAFTVNVTGADVVVAPRLSVAFEVSVWVPSGTLFHAWLYGVVVSVAASVPLRKNSTFDTVPSASDALAVTVRFSGATRTALLAGAVIAVDGGRLTIAVTAGEVVTAPLSSVALAVSVYVPPATFVHECV